MKSIDNFYADTPVQCAGGTLHIVSRVQITGACEDGFLLCSGGKSPVGILLRQRGKDTVLAIDEEQIDIATLRAFT